VNAIGIFGKIFNRALKIKDLANLPLTVQCADRPEEEIGTAKRAQLASSNLDQDRKRLCFLNPSYSRVLSLIRASRDLYCSAIWEFVSLGVG
jgi:hypothetical protein